MKYKRMAYYKVKEVMDDYIIPILVGLRRTGKTTILKQLKENNENSEIIRCDSLMIRSLTNLQLFEYISELIQKGVKTLLLDEIQVIKNWDILIKDLFDTYMDEKKVKIVVTGSSSLSFENKDTGVTRTRKVLITTLSFDEYCELSNKPKTKEEFETYLGMGAFPEHVGKNLSIDEMIAQSLEPILNDDIPSHYKVESGNVIRLLYELSHLTNGEFNASRSSKNTGIERKQIFTYLDILEKCQIIKRVYKINERGEYGRYRSFKVYINPHFHLWILNKTFKTIPSSKVGHIIESYWLYAETQIDGYYKKFVYMKNNEGEEIDFISFGGNDKYKTLHEFKYTLNAISTNKLFITTPSENKVIWYLGPRTKKANIQYENIIQFK